MNYTEVTIECKNTDETCDRLTALGVDGFVVENEDDFKAFLENNASIGTMSIPRSRKAIRAFRALNSMLRTTRTVLGCSTP